MRLIVLLLFAFSTVLTNATPSDSLKLETLQRTVTSDSVKIANLQKEVTNLKSAITRLKQEDAKLQIQNQKQATDFDSLKAAQNQQDANVNSLATKLDTDILTANKKIDDNVGSLNDSINSRTRSGVIGILLAVMLLAVVYFILRKKINSGSSSISKIKAAQESLEAAQKAMQEESVKLDSKLLELLDKQVANQPKESGDKQPDHSLALKVADEIVRIETNLSHMDESVKGYKQLKKAVERIRDNFMANGYEIVDMLGKPFSEGMKLDNAEFVYDETLSQGEQKITGIKKPQVNYNGKMIQAAYIKVSQNI